MGQLPLPSREADRPARERTKAGRLRRATRWLGAPAQVWLGTRTIRDGATFAGEMAASVRLQPHRDRRFHVSNDGTFDLVATAFSYGIPVPELERRLAASRRQTGLASYALGGAGVVLFLLWLIAVLNTELTAGRILVAVEFLPLCAMCVLLGFYQGLVNFQIRSGRAASWRDFLLTERDFWPRP